MPKPISGPVGVSGRNSPPVDVMTIQYLLNCIPSDRGGPQAELMVDGICGPLTIAAIRRFQKWTFGWADGRVDPGGKTVAALQAYDPYPNEALPLGLVVGKTTGDGTFGKQPVAPGGKSGGKFGAAAGGKGGGGGGGAGSGFKSDGTAGGKGTPGGKGAPGGKSY